MVDHGQDVAKDVPKGIYFCMTFLPYVACAISVCCHVFITLAYSMKFQRIAERYWYYSTTIGVSLVLVVLELMRSAVMTIVELRKFEIRRRLQGGDFNRSRIRKQTGKEQDLVRKDKKKPAVPSVPPKKPAPQRPPPPPKDMSFGPPPPDISPSNLAPPPPPRPGFLP